MIVSSNSFLPCLDYKFKFSLIEFIYSDRDFSSLFFMNKSLRLFNISYFSFVFTFFYLEFVLSDFNLSSFIWSSEAYKMKALFLPVILFN